MNNIKIGFIFPCLLLLFSCIASYQKLKYPDEFPADIVNSTQNVDAIVAAYHKAEKDSIDLITKKPNWNKRQKASILKGIMQNLAQLRYAYNKRLREKPGLYGKITMKYSILDDGSVNSAIVTFSTIKDTILESIITAKILKWHFEKLADVKDTTEVVYPFVFSQGQSEDDVWNLDVEETKNGDRPTEDILKAIDELKSGLLPVYDNAPKKSGFMGATISVSMEIRPDGFIENIKLTNSFLDSPKTEIEMLKEIRKWVFAKCSTCNGNTKIEYTFRFQEIY
jgi:hypothetical protein